MSEPTPTPAVIIDLPIVRRNIDRLAAYGREHKLRIRPHTKTHKSIRFARMQMQAGAVGLTTAKAGEALTMSQAADDLFVAYPALDPWRAPRLARLAREKMIRVGVDSAYALDVLSNAARAAGSTIGILVDIDVGLHRTGVQSPADALALAQHVSRKDHVRLDGIMCYPGQIKAPLSEQPAALEPVAHLLQETIELWRRSGLEAATVSGGSSPSAYQSHLVPQLSEIRPGTYIFNDMSMVSCGHASMEDCAARVVCTVISTAVPGKFVIDAGSKTLTQDRRSKDPDTAGFGHVVEYPQARITRLSEEHGEVNASQCAKRPKLGERVHVIPNHICPCVNLQTMVWLRDERGNLEPTEVDARGQVW